MKKGDREILQGAAMMASIFAVLVCGIGLVFMSVGDSVNPDSFIRIGIATNRGRYDRCGWWGVRGLEAFKEEKGKERNREQSQAEPSRTPE